MIPGCSWILDFWPLGGGGSLGYTLRGLFDLFRVLVVLPLSGLLVGLSITAAIALWRRHFRHFGSSMFAIAAIPFCFLSVASVPLFDPWLWYAIANRARFEALAGSGPGSDGSEYALIEIRDVSTGLAGASPNHFVALIYDESNAVGRDPSERAGISRTRTLWPSEKSAFGLAPIPRGRRLFGHFFRVDDFE